MNVHAAFKKYESIRHRLPAPNQSGAGIVADNLGEISDQFDAFLLDAFGVLNIGETAIPHSPKRVASLQGQGKRILVVSNAASLPRSELVQKYAGLGYEFAPEDIITSRAATLRGLQDYPAHHWGLMLPSGGVHADLHHINATRLGDDANVYEDVDGFLLLGSSTWTSTRQELLLRAIKNNPRPVVVGNPDIIAPREHGFSVEPGSFAHDIADQIGITPQFFGKPFQNIFDLALARLPGVDPDRILMVGDSLHTDILGGQTAGVKTALITGYGFCVGADVATLIRTSDIQPDFILKRP